MATMINFPQALCPCGVIDGGAHHPDCIPCFDLDLLPYFTDGNQSMDQGGTNGESSHYTLDGVPPIDYEHPTNEVINGGFVPLPVPAVAGAQYVLNPAGANHPAFYGVPGTLLYGTCDDGANASYPAPAPPSINTQFSNVGNIFPSPNSASTDTTMYTNNPDLHSPLSSIQTVGSDIMRTVSKGRRKKDPIYSCSYPGCTATFTAKHNYNYHWNSHLGLRPYKCPFLGCNVGAAAPRTLKRHSKTCRYNPENVNHR